MESGNVLAKSEREVQDYRVRSPGMYSRSPESGIAECGVQGVCFQSLESRIADTGVRGRSREVRRYLSAEYQSANSTHRNNRYDP